MFIKDSESGKWVSIDDTLSREYYESKKEDFESVKLYSKCLSGATFSHTNSILNIYDILKYKDNVSYFNGGKSFSTYSMDYRRPKKPFEEYEKQDIENYNSLGGNILKYLEEYGLTLKTSFTPNGIIDDDLCNFIDVFYATTPIENIEDVLLNRIDINKHYRNDLIIDSIEVKEGEAILIKDNYSKISLDSNIDPEIFFNSKDFFKIKDNGTTIEYYYKDNSNGLYILKEGKLIRTSSYEDYSEVRRLMFFVHNGIVNKEKIFYLNRNSNGLYPTKEDYVHDFIEGESWIIRNKLEYNNSFETNYNNIYYSKPKTLNINGLNKNIPSRILALGDYGTFILNQDNISNAINSQFRGDLKDISETENYYWLCGTESTVLKVNKLTLEIQYLEINDNSLSLNSIDFINDTRGVVVGDLNTIYYTLDGGLKWIQINIPNYERFNYYKVIYDKFDTIYVGGSKGAFIVLKQNIEQWSSYKKYINKKENEDLDKIIDDDIISMEKVNDNLLLIVSKNGEIIKYHIKDNKFTFLYLDSNHKDAKSTALDVNNNGLYISNGNIHKVFYNRYNTPLNASSNCYKLDSSETEGYIKINNINANGMFYTDNILYLAGNDSNLGFLMGDENYQKLDNTFDSRLSSKLLFLDYNIASKLNFFTLEGDYKLPYEISFPSKVYSNIRVGHDDNETDEDYTFREKSWLDYYKKSLETYEYGCDYDGTSKLNAVTFNNQFIKSNNPSISNLTIVNDVNIIKGLAPTITQKNKNNYFIKGGFNPIDNSANKNLIMLYGNLLLIKYKKGDVNQFNLNKGDVINFESNVINTKLIVNKVITLANNYSIAYVYTNFNDSIINDLLKSQNSIKITNLNRFKGIDDFIENFNNHYIGYGYKITMINNNFKIEALFNNFTAYYNMEIPMKFDNLENAMKYKESFLNFGFSPTYNLMDYLSKINAEVFHPKKEFIGLPSFQFKTVRFNDNNKDYSVYSRTVRPDHIILGKGLENEWKSIPINTYYNIYFGDLDEDTNLPLNTVYKVLIREKYKDENTGEFYIKFDSKIEFSQNDVISIKSRNKLKEISDDLTILNNIQRMQKSKLVYDKGYIISLDTSVYKSFYTDSYAKALLCDGDIKRQLSGIVYIDNLNKLSVNIINLAREEYLSAISIKQEGGFYTVVFDRPHNLKESDYIIINAIYPGDENIDGYHVVRRILSEDSIQLQTQAYAISTDNMASVKISERDLFMNFVPIDLMKIGTDKISDRAIEIKPKNILVIDSTYNIVNLNFKNYRYELVDGLSLYDINDKYSWLLEAEFKNAVIGKDSNGIVWYSGKWLCGRWFGGTWYSGDWYGGDWYKGNWYSRSIDYKLYKVEVGANLETNSSNWYNGRWYDGNWNGGTWYNGRWYNGTWNNGLWHLGLWDSGEWNNGTFSGGVWISGNWNNGKFNSNSNNAYWLNGNWYGGDFESGRWFNGTFNKRPTTISRFGTKSTISKQAIWDTGTFNGGEFHCGVDKISNGINYKIHKNSYWKTGIFNGGDFYGGVAYNINFKTGNWYGGILDDIEIVKIEIGKPIFPTEEYSLKITTNGIFRFMDNSEIFLMSDILSDEVPTNDTYNLNIFGSLDSFLSYKIITLEVDEVSNTTTMHLSSSISKQRLDSALNNGVNSFYSFVDKRFDSKNGSKYINTKLVSKFINCNWYNGTWYNGIFTNGNFYGGSFHDGHFNGNWGM